MLIYIILSTKMHQLGYYKSICTLGTCVGNVFGPYECPLVVQFHALSMTIFLLYAQLCIFHGQKPVARTRRIMFRSIRLKNNHAHDNKCFPNKLVDLQNPREHIPLQLTSPNKYGKKNIIQNRPTTRRSTSLIMFMCTIPNAFQIHWIHRNHKYTYTIAQTRRIDLMMSKKPMSNQHNLTNVGNYIRQARLIM